jgi:thymidylate synthase
MNNVDKEYFRLINTVLTNGKRKKNRTGIDTIGVFGEQAKFDINLDEFPILTTKKVFFRGILHELLWFIKGDTNIKYLVDNDVHIWDEWVFKRYSDWYNKIRGDTTDFTINWNGTEPVQYTQDEFIQKIKDDVEFAKKWGELGEGTYGGMWRNFPFYTEESDFVGSSTVTGTGEEFWVFGGVDQLKKVVEKLKSNPDDRRMIVSAWHPYWVDHCALPPCHCLFHFNTEELTIKERYEYADKIGLPLGVAVDLEKQVLNEPECLRILSKYNIPERRLNCLLYIRSNDMFLGCPFNITSYSLLTAMVAHCVNMVPGILTYTIGDCHLYQNHIEQVKLQLSRTPKTLPKLWLNPNVKDLFSFKYEDVKLIDYDPHPAIKADVAV